MNRNVNGQSKKHNYSIEFSLKYEYVKILTWDGQEQGNILISKWFSVDFVRGGLPNLKCSLKR